MICLLYETWISCLLRLCDSNTGMILHILCGMWDCIALIIKATYYCSENRTKQWKMMCKTWICLHTHSFPLWSFDKVYSTAAALLKIIFVWIFIALSSQLLLDLHLIVPVITVLCQCCILVWQSNAKGMLNTYMEQTI